MERCILKFAPKLAAWTTLVVISVTGAFLRLYHLGGESLWFDELATWYHTSHPTWLQVMQANALEPMPQGYYTLMYGVRALFGSSEWALRLPSAIAGVISIPAAYWLGLTFFDRAVGLFSATLMATSVAPIFHSRDARHYSILLLLSILLGVFWRKLTQARFKPPLQADMIYFGIICLGLSLTHYFGAALSLLASMSLAAIFLIRGERQSLRNLTIVLSAVAILISPLLPKFATDVVNGHPYINWIEKPNLMSLAEFGKWALISCDDSLWLPILLALGTLVVLFSCFLHKMPNRTHQFSLVAAALWLALPVGATFVKSLLSYSVFWPRHLIITIPALYLLIAYSLNQISLRTRLSGAQLSICLLLLIFRCYQLIAPHGLFSKPHNPQWREVTKYAEEHVRDPDHTVLLVRGKRYFNYYAAELFNKLPSDNVINLPAVFQLTPLIEPEQIPAYAQELVVMQAHVPQDISSQLGPDWQAVETKLFVGARFDLLRRTPR